MQERSAVHADNMALTGLLYESWDCIVPAMSTGALRIQLPQSLVLPQLTLKKTFPADACAVAPRGTAQQICLYARTGTISKSHASLRIEW